MDFAKIKQLCEQYRQGITKEMLIEGCRFKRKPEVNIEYKKQPISDAKLKERIFKENPFISLTMNEFPYHIDPSVLHCILWFHPDFFAALPDEIFIRCILQGWIDSKYQWTYYENPPPWKSIQEIPHVHVFISPSP